MSHFIDYKQFIDDSIPFYAHKSDSRERESLGEHIERCEYYFERLATEKDVEGILQRFVHMMKFKDYETAFNLVREMLYQLVVFHDFGKINPVFQYKKMDNQRFKNKQYEGLSGANHSLLSSIFYLDYYLGRLDEMKRQLDLNDRKKLIEIVFENAYVISKHHGNFDSLSAYINSLKNDNGKLVLNLVENGIEGYIGFSSKTENSERVCLRYFASKDFNKIVNQYFLKKAVSNMNVEEKRKMKIAKVFYLRLAYSILVSCDYYATAEYSSGFKNDSFGNFTDFNLFREDYENSDLMKSIRKYEKEKYGLDDLKSITDINSLRCEIFLDAEKGMQHYALEGSDYLYFLEAPTGSGKSNIALNLSLNIHNNLKKMFYIYPFNSLVEQNRQNLLKLFQNEVCINQIQVVNSITPMGERIDSKNRAELNRNEEDGNSIDEAISYYQKFLLDRQFLNYPFILSTHVSFFRTLFGIGREDIFGFLQLSGSVVILDEIQSYRNSIWAEIVIFLNICAELMDMRIIIMSATLPNLEILAGNEYESRYLISESGRYFSHSIFKNRVELFWDLLNEEMNLEKLIKIVVDCCGDNKRILIEFIRKDTAYEFYRMLNEETDIYEPIRLLTGDDSVYDRELILEPIRNGSAEGMILVATQVVEAGVDIDMDIGFKNISILDSEEQFLGRINRSCRKNGKAYFFSIDEASRIYKDDYRTEESLTLKTDEMKSVLENKEFGDYYIRVMNSLMENRNNSTSEDGLDYFINNHVGSLNFNKIGDRMELISEDKWHISVVICRRIEISAEETLDGWEIWTAYKDLLKNNEMDYSEKQYKISEVRSKLNYFTYTLKRDSQLVYNDKIGELLCIEDGERFFVDGKLDRNLIVNAGGLFIDL